MRHYFFIILFHFIVVISCLEDGNSGADDRVNSKEQLDNANEMINGGLAEQNPEDPVFKKMAQESLNKYLHDIGSNQHHQLLQVTKVTTQVVAGTMTRINFNAAPTNCQLTSNSKPSNPPCVVTDLSKTITCYSEIWEQPWINEKDEKVSCTPKV